MLRLTKLAIISFFALAVGGPALAKKTTPLGSEARPIYTVAVQPPVQPYGYPYDCRKPKDAEQDNLCIQKRIADGTEKAARFSEQSYWVGIFNFLLVMLSLAFAGGSVYLTRKSLLTTKEIGQAQVRAYLHATSLRMRISRDNNTGYAFIEASNSGQSPAFDVTWTMDARVNLEDGSRIEDFNLPIPSVVINSGSNSGLTPLPFHAPLGIRKFMKDTKDKFMLEAQIDIFFTDVFGRPGTARSYFVGVMSWDLINLESVWLGEFKLVPIPFEW